MLKRLILLSLLVSGLHSSSTEIKTVNVTETVDVKVCVDTTKVTGRSFKQMKDLLISIAQDEGFNSLYKTAIGKENKNTLSLHHRKDLIVKVNNMLDEGNNFCNTSTVSIKKDRLQYYLPQKVSKDRICHKDENLSPVELKKVAALKGYKALISEISNKEISNDLAKLLVHRYRRNDGKMYMSKGAYCFGASGEVVPFEIDIGTLSTSNNSQTTVKVINNKGYAKVYGRNGTSWEFNVDFNENGFGINKKYFKKLQKSLIGGNKISGTITTKLLIPKDIKTDTIDIMIDGEASLSYGSYYSLDTYINGYENKKILQGVEVLHSNGKRYIDLVVAFEAEKKEHFMVLLKFLNTISYSTEGAKLIPFIFDRPTFQEVKAKVYGRNGTSWEFNVDFNGNGFGINKKYFKKLQKSLITGNPIAGTITTKLLIPKDIKTDTIDIMIDGIASIVYGGARDLHTHINGYKDKEAIQGVEVLHSNGKRYIDLVVTFESNNKDHFIKLLKSLNTISYSATDTEDGEKWYDLNKLLVTKDTKVKV